MRQKEAILQVAVNLFKKNGYASTSMQDIARELKCTKAAIYYYFNSKEEVLMTAIDNTMSLAEENLTQVLTRELTKNLSPPEVLKEILVTHIKTMFEEKTYITVFFFDKHNLSEKNLNIIRQRHRIYEKEIARVIRRGINEGYFTALEELPVVYGVLGMCNWMVQWYKPDGNYGLDEIAETYWQLIFQGIKKS